MFRYEYLIVGGGMAAASAVQGIREVDREGPIGLVSAESDPPYDRPPLSKGLWKGKPLDEIWRDVQATGTEVRLGREITRLDLGRKIAVDGQGEEYHFDRLLLATGGTPRRLPFGGDDLVYFRNLADYRRLREISDRGQHFAVIGGGFIGSEVAAALAMNGKEVTMLFPEHAIGAKVYPDELAQFINGYYREKGVRLLTGETVAAIERRGEHQVLTTGGGTEIVADGVIAGLGITPNLDLPREAGLEVAGGILVDEMLRTSHPHVFAAGDVAEFYSPVQGRRVRVEHEDNAHTMGRLAGRAMAGQPEPYRHQPFFYSDLFDLGYEAVGQLDSRLETVADWKELYREGVVYYLQDDRLRGVLLWNVWEQVDAARALLEEPGPFRAEELIGRIPAAIEVQAA